jgi:hypothetical protein
MWRRRGRGTEMGRRRGRWGGTESYKKGRKNKERERDWAMEREWKGDLVMERNRERECDTGRKKRDWGMEREKEWEGDMERERDWNLDMGEEEELGLGYGEGERLGYGDSPACLCVHVFVCVYAFVCVFFRYAYICI